MVRVLIAAAFACVVSTVAHADGDPGRGRGVFLAQCSTCHSAAKNGGAIVGPPLYGVVGRPAATVPGFAYSSAMRATGFVWTADRLHAYLPAPRALVPGTKMSFPGLKNPAQLDDLVAYLQTLK